MTTAMVLAAGRGVRMQPLTAERAKPALPVLGAPLIARIVAGLAAQGIGSIAVNAFHCADSVRAVVEDAASRHDVRASVFVEEQLMGSAGALLAPADVLGQSPTFLWHNADTLVHVPVGELERAAAGDRRLGALLVRRGRTPGYGGVVVEDGLVRHRFAPDEEPHGPNPATFLGVAAVRREILDHVPRGRASDLFPDVVLPLLRDGWSLAVVPYEGPWLEFTSPRSYVANIARLVVHAAPAGIVRLPGGDAILRPMPGGTLFVAESAVVDDAVMVEGFAAVERGARVERGAILRNAVVLEGAHVGWGASLTDVVVDRNVRIPRATAWQHGVVVAPGDGNVLRPFTD